ncbi:putative flippase GtrA [Blastococcus colisei]|uniref:Putative flippase GtrA n=1 Tax=Blastococcus colisei TaxID=1564162 RepID=A0A543PBP2_9ACTN|nr:GtrA family protein [Blastococcus colisei]TQN41506.1 putative flippase GtrA [Blastococcus colisei]
MREPVRDRPAHTYRVLVRELSAFGVVGATCFALDVALFQLLYVQFGVGAVTAKLVATLTSMAAAFVGHRYWSFAHRARTGVRRESLRFAAVNVLTLGLGLTVVAVVRYPLGQESVAVLQAANVASIGLGTVLRFLAYRVWVFPRRPISSDAGDPSVTAGAPFPSSTEARPQTT